MLQAELWGHHEPEKAKQVRQLWDAVTAENDRVFESYRRAFEQLDRDREARQRDAPKDIPSSFPSTWQVVFAQPPAGSGVAAETKKPDSL